MYTYNTSNGLETAPGSSDVWKEGKIKEILSKPKDRFGIVLCEVFVFFYFIIRKQDIARDFGAR